MWRARWGECAKFGCQCRATCGLCTAEGVGVDCRLPPLPPLPPPPPGPGASSDTRAGLLVRTSPAELEETGAGAGAASDGTDGAAPDLTLTAVLLMLVGGAFVGVGAAIAVCRACRACCGCGVVDGSGGADHSELASAIDYDYEDDDDEYGYDVDEFGCDADDRLALQSLQLQQQGLHRQRRLAGLGLRSARCGGGGGVPLVRLTDLAGRGRARR